jgi:integrase/recombinase XerD
VSVSRWGRRHGYPLNYGAVYALVRRLRRETGIDFEAHWLRRAAATRLLRDDAGIEFVARLLGHASVTTTAALYGHPSTEDKPMSSD